MPIIRALPTTLALALLLTLPVGLTPAQVSCGAVLTGDTTLNQDLTCVANGLKIGADHVTLDCAGHVIRGPGTTVGAGVATLGVSGVTITNCHITGFRTAIQAENAAGLRIIQSILFANSTGISCTGCLGATIEGNQLDQHLSQVRLIESPDARIVHNVMSPYPKGGGGFYLRGSPRAVISGNRAPEGGASSLLDGCDGSVIEDNDLVGNATIAFYRSHHCRVARNTLVRGATTHNGYGGYVSLSGSSDNLVCGNRIEGTFGIQVSDGADRNVIDDNLISDSGLGLILFGASENRILENRIERTEIGLGIFGLSDPASSLNFPADRNLVQANTIRGGLYGIGTWRTSGNQFLGNEILDHWIGLYEGPVGPFDTEPNSYSENSIAGNRLFGLLVIGGSPLLERNEFQGNGSPDPPPAELEPYLTLLGDLRGGIALVPLVGDDFTFDNADPSDDLLASPIIGGPGRKNLFTDNIGVDIYALDTRAANAAMLERDNQYKGETSTRIRQDWFGLVRVENTDGGPVSEADVEIRDAGGATVARLITDSSGIAPASVDPDRSQGRTPLEEGGPIPPWPRLTEYIVDAGGRRQELTPHTVVVDAYGQTGCETFTWDGMPDETPGSTSPLVRYQTAVVRLGCGCERRCTR